MSQKLNATLTPQQLTRYWKCCLFYSGRFGLFSKLESIFFMTSCSHEGNNGCNGGMPIYSYSYASRMGIATEASYPFTSVSGSTVSS